MCLLHWCGKRFVEVVGAQWVDFEVGSGMYEGAEVVLAECEEICIFAFGF